MKHRSDKMRKMLLSLATLALSAALVPGLAFAADAQTVRGGVIL